MQTSFYLKYSDYLAPVSEQINYIPNLSLAFHTAKRDIFTIGKSIYSFLKNNRFLLMYLKCQFLCKLPNHVLNLKIELNT
jgi:hypothetical protein